MKKITKHYAVAFLALLLTCFSYLPTYAADLHYFQGKSVTDWNQVDRDSDFFDEDDFVRNYMLMPEGTWIKSTGSSYSQSGGGASNVTRFTTDAGADDFEPADAVMYKFAAGETQKSITLSIADGDDDEDNRLFVAVLIDGRWQNVTSFATIGEDYYQTFTAELPEEATAVMLYMPDDEETIYLGATTVESIPETTLPLAIYDVAAKRATNTITWKVGVEEGVDYYNIQGSDDASHWVNITTVEADGTATYSTALTDMGHYGSLFLWLLACLVPVTLGKRKKKVVVMLGAVILACGSMISCSKSDTITPGEQNNLYKYYRVQSVAGELVLKTSTVITLE